MLFSGPKSSYYDEYQRKKETNRSLQSPPVLLTDRAAYVNFLEIQLERVSSACLSVQSYDQKFSDLQNLIVNLEQRCNGTTKLVSLSQQCTEEINLTKLKSEIDQEREHYGQMINQMNSKILSLEDTIKSLPTVLSKLSLLESKFYSLEQEKTKSDLIHHNEMQMNKTKIDNLSTENIELKKQIEHLNTLISRNLFDSEEANKKLKNAINLTENRIKEQITKNTEEIESKLHSIDCKHNNHYDTINYSISQREIELNNIHTKQYYSIGNDIAELNNKYTTQITQLNEKLSLLQDKNRDLSSDFTDKNTRNTVGTNQSLNNLLLDKIEGCIDTQNSLQSQVFYLEKLVISTLQTSSNNNNNNNSNNNSSTNTLRSEINSYIHNISGDNGNNSGLNSRNSAGAISVADFQLQQQQSDIHNFRTSQSVPNTPVNNDNRNSISSNSNNSSNNINSNSRNAGSIIIGSNKSIFDNSKMDISELQQTISSAKSLLQQQQSQQKSQQQQSSQQQYTGSYNDNNSEQTLHHSQSYVQLPSLPNTPNSTPGRLKRSASRVQTDERNSNNNNNSKIGSNSGFNINSRSVTPLSQRQKDIRRSRSYSPPSRTATLYNNDSSVKNMLNSGDICSDVFYHVNGGNNSNSNSNNNSNNNSRNNSRSNSQHNSRNNSRSNSRSNSVERKTRVSEGSGVQRKPLRKQSSSLTRSSNKNSNNNDNNSEKEQLLSTLVELLSTVAQQNEQINELNNSSRNNDNNNNNNNNSSNRANDKDISIVLNDSYNSSPLRILANKLRNSTGLNNSIDANNSTNSNYNAHYPTTATDVNNDNSSDDDGDNYEKSYNKSAIMNHSNIGSNRPNSSTTELLEHMNNKIKQSIETIQHHNYVGNDFSHSSRSNIKKTNFDSGEKQVSFSQNDHKRNRSSADNNLEQYNTHHYQPQYSYSEPLVQPMWKPTKSYQHKPLVHSVDNNNRSNNSNNISGNGNTNLATTSSNNINSNNNNNIRDVTLNSIKTQGATTTDNSSKVPYISYAGNNIVTKNINTSAIFSRYNNNNNNNNNSNIVTRSFESDHKMFRDITPTTRQRLSKILAKTNHRNEIRKDGSVSGSVGFGSDLSVRSIDVRSNTTVKSNTTSTSTGSVIGSVVTDDLSSVL